MGTTSTLPRQKHPSVGWVSICASPPFFLKTFVFTEEYLFNAFKQKLTLRPNSSHIIATEHETKTESTFCNTSFKLLLYFECIDGTLKEELNTKLMTKQHYSEKELLEFIENVVDCLIALQEGHCRNAPLTLNTIVFVKGRIKLIDEIIAGECKKEINEDNNNLRNINLNNNSNIVSTDMMKDTNNNNFYYHPPESPPPSLSTPKGDIFTLGMLVLHMITFESLTPYYYSDSTIDYDSIIHRVSKINYSLLFKTLLAQMLEYDIDYRISAFRLKDTLLQLTQPIKRTKSAALLHQLIESRDSTCSGQKNVTINKESTNKNKIRDAISMENQIEVRSYTRLIQDSNKNNAERESYENITQFEKYIISKEEKRNSNKNNQEQSKNSSHEKTRYHSKNKSTYLINVSSAKKSIKEKEIQCNKENILLEKETSGKLKANTFKEINFVQNNSVNALKSLVHRKTTFKDAISPIQAENNKKNQNSLTKVNTFSSIEYIKEGPQSFKNTSTFENIISNNKNNVNNLSNNGSIYECANEKHRLEVSSICEKEFNTIFPCEVNKSPLLEKCEFNNDFSEKLPKIMSNLTIKLTDSPESYERETFGKCKNKFEMGEKSLEIMYPTTKEIEESCFVFDYRRKEENKDKEEKGLYNKSEDKRLDQEEDKKRYEHERNDYPMQEKTESVLEEDYQGDTICVNGHEIREGNGVLLKKGIIEYSGSWKNNLYHGFGSMFNFQPTEDAAFDEQVEDYQNIFQKKWNRYEGEFREGQMHGFGTLYFTVGKEEKFSGCFRWGKIEGYGCYYSNKGMVTGLWNNGIYQ